MEESQTTPRKRGRPRKAVSTTQASVLPRLLNRQQLGTALNCSRQKTYDLEANDPEFPGPIVVGTTPQWLEPEVAHYLKRKADARPCSVREGVAATRDAEAA